MANRVIPSAELVVYVNGAPFGIATTFSWQSNTQKRAIRGIDCAEAIELAPMMVSVTGQMSVVRLHSGGLETMEITASFENQSREKYISILVIDRATQAIIFRADSCSITSQQWSASARGMVMGQVSFEALEWSSS